MLTLMIHINSSQAWRHKWHESKLNRRFLNCVLLSVQSMGVSPWIHRSIHDIWLKVNEKLYTQEPVQHQEVAFYLERVCHIVLVII